MAISGIPVRQPSSTSSLNRKLLVAVVAFLILLQYLNLLKAVDDDEGGRRKQKRFQQPLFSIDDDQQLRRRTILLSVEQFYEARPSLSSSSSLSSQSRTISSIPSLSHARSKGEQSETMTNGTGMTNVLPVCPMIPPDLHGPVKVLLGDEVPQSMDEIEQRYPHLHPGGRSYPRNCQSRHRVAIIVPYRDRPQHLRTLVVNLHHFLANQQLDYTLYVVEQAGGEPFNRAMLLNVGAKEALRLTNGAVKCFIFHDVDLLPEDDRNLYSCPSVQPRHMSVSIDTFGYHLPYDDIFGGVSALSVDQFKAVNGFSNIFWGWGGEDDDMANRLRHKKLYISRYPANVARYKMLKHSKVKANPERFKYLYSGAKRMTKDGFNSLKYKVVDLKLLKLYTWILAELEQVKL